VPSSQDGHGGWLVATADRMNGPDDYDSELWILEADAIGKGPIARAKFPERIKPQVHGWWVPLAEYEAAKG
jgi:carotenoid cleavage dioxygenase